MTEVLRPYLAYDPAETHTSFVRRLARFHTGKDAGRLLADLGLDPRDINRGDAEAVRSLASVAGIDPATLLAGVIGRIDRCRTFRGERWTRDFVVPEGAKFCPSCLMEDVELNGATHQKFRIGWRLRSVGSCPTHQRALIALEKGRGGNDLSARMFSMRELNEFGDRALPINPTDLERWISDRLDGNGRDGWLERQTIEQVVRASEMLGAMLEHGNFVNLKGMAAETLRAGAATGFGIVGEGPECVREALDAVRGAATSTAGQAGPKAMYGRLYEWLAYTTPIVDRGPIVDLLRDHILDHTAIEPGEVVLGQEVVRRRMHSVHSLSVATGFHRKRLRKILELKGLVPTGCSDVALNHLVFPAEETEQLCREIRDAIPLNRLPILLSGTRTQVTSLHHTGVLPALVDRSYETSIGRIDFSRDQIDRFLSEIEGLPEPADGVAVVDLTTATKKTGRSTGELVRFVLEGRLTAWHQRSLDGLKGLRISTSALKALEIHAGNLSST